MKIGSRQPGKISAPSPRTLWLFGLLILAFIIGWIAANQDWQEINRDVRSVPDLISKSVVPSQDLATLVIDMNFARYDDLLDQREKALQAGVHIPSAQDFVTATVRVDQAAIPINMRLLPGPADHLDNEGKWGFEVRTRNDQQLLGMQRLYLLDPAANNWLNEWAFARALEREGILVAHYRFVHLIFNGNDRGIYALQEGFADELLMAQGRPAGVIVEFDADLLWKSIAHFQGDAQATYADPIANLSAADFRRSPEIPICPCKRTLRLACCARSRLANSRHLTHLTWKNTAAFWPWSICGAQPRARR
jgi:hypothetical protein